MEGDEDHFDTFQARQTRADTFGRSHSQDDEEENFDRGDNSDFEDDDG